MPTYKTHSIHIDKSSDYIDKRIELDKEALKVFSFGPDSLVFSDNTTFNKQHNMDSRNFFECLLRTIKVEHAIENKETISFLYGQISHYILDTTFHPYIYYLTIEMKNNKAIDPHLQFELWMDRFITQKYGIDNKDYYSKTSISDEKTRQIIDRVYQHVYNCYFASNKYDIGISALTIFELNIRQNKFLMDVLNLVNVGDFEYGDASIFDQFLNTTRQMWQNPITGENHIESINELWNASVSAYLETIYDINRYLYDDKPLKNRFIESNLSYDTALPCDVPKKFVYTKKY